MTLPVPPPRIDRTGGTFSRFIRMAFGVSLVGSMLSCVDDAPLSPGHGATAQLGLLASITGLSVEGDYTVHVTITSAGSEGPTDLPIEPDFFALSADAATVQPITVDLSSCPEGCQLSAVLTLSDDVGDLATDTIDLGLVHQGDRVTPADTVKLVPRYELTIDGGGEGTGSGTVEIAATAGEPALRCEITSGSPAETGCSARYPIHTAITLVATAPRGTTLDSWAGDCAAAAPDAACELIMDGRRTARARFRLPPTKGDLEIQIAGLPTGAQAQVTVANARGFSRQLTESAVLSSLEPGDYTVSAEPVVAEDLTYLPDPATQSISIVAGERAIAQIGYNPPTTGSLAVTITGLPNGVLAQVTVAGPAFSNPQQLTAGSTFAGLPPGNYTVTARSVTGPSGQPYDPSVIPTQTAAVTAGHSTTVTVAYSVPPAARLAFTGQLGTVISGVPISPAITVEVRDAQNRLAPGFTGQVTLSLRGGTPGAALRGTVAAIPLRGVASFVQLTIDLAGSGYVLAATAPSLSAGESAPFAVVAGAVSPIQSSIEVSRPTLRTCCGTDTITVTARDAVGNPIQGASVNLSATGTQNVLVNPSLPTDANGVTRGSFASRTIGRKTISAAVNGVVLTRVGTVDVGAGLIFSRFVLNVGDIIATNPDGTEPANITRTGRHEGDPAWSRDGSRVAYVVTFCLEENCFSDIYSMSADGSDTLNLTAGLEGSASSPAWSPDGSRIAFTLDTCNDGCLEVFVMNRDGSNPQSLTGENGGSSPTWSPAGGQIAFARFCGGQVCRNDIWIIQFAQDTTFLLTGAVDGSSTSPSWSPDGSRIAFVSQPCDTCRAEVLTINATDGSNPVSLTPNPPRDALSPTWSPDGRRIAFATDCPFEFCENELFVMNDNGSGLTRLGLGTDPDWR